MWVQKLCAMCIDCILIHKHYCNLNIFLIYLIAYFRLGTLKYMYVKTYTSMQQYQIVTNMESIKIESEKNLNQTKPNMLCMWDTNITMLKMIFAMIIKICKMEGLQQYSLWLFEKIFLFLSINKAIIMSATIIKVRNTGFFTVLLSCTNIRQITTSSTLTAILN